MVGKALVRARTLREPLGYKGLLISESSRHGNHQGSARGAPHPRSLTCVHCPCEPVLPSTLVTWRKETGIRPA